MARMVRERKKERKKNKRRVLGSSFSHCLCTTRCMRVCVFLFLCLCYTCGTGVICLVAVCCSVLQRVAVYCILYAHIYKCGTGVGYLVAACCDLLHSVAACCRVLHLVYS